MDFAARVSTPPRTTPARMLRCLWRQASLTPVCPPTPRLDGKLALVTGGNAGIGREISRGLAQRGARVLIAARTASRTAEACTAIAAETGATLEGLGLDLSDLRSVGAAATRVRELSGGRPLDLVVNNAGLWPRRYARSAQGHELAFATNTLGHHALVRRLLDAGLLPRARVVVLTGDIYVRAHECTSDFTWNTAAGGASAYCRSKLGNLWWVAELQRRVPALEVCAAHPGVVASGLGGELGGWLGARLRRMVMIDVAAGAQTPLWCATQPIERGGYYHNTLGRLVLRATDPALDAQGAAELWARLEALSA